VTGDAANTSAGAAGGENAARWTSDRARRYFAERADQYDAKSRRGLWAHLRSIETPVVMQMAAVRPGERVLDAGCGAGHYTEALVAAGARVTALDALRPMLERVRERLRVEGVHGDLATVRLEPVYDKVVCAGVLEFVPDRERALANLARGLRVEGPREITLLILARCVTGYGYWLLRRCNGFSVPMYTRRGLERLAGEAGLRVVELRRAGFNWVARLTPIS